MIRVIFVCLGNICRSPMAEAVFIDLVEKAGLSQHFEIDSAGTSNYHVGESAHRGTRKVLAEHGIAYQGRSRQFTPADLNMFDYIVAMDSENEADLQQLAGQHPTANEPKLVKLLTLARQTPLIDVPDPYYVDRFEDVYQAVLDGCEGLLAHIRAEHTL